ncbi:RNA polymerase II subunit A C-terminal domain phosphatase SSU72 isoform X1 [Ochotona princeps]|uniref:RNA polymerase II subunit A C-terminal domain phosphatase SSU72 isoform X1 n=1 Tax=Ochotona princeps TaxID=9978 RepID=UPI0027148677|nr:RNA polymerase II subunit A C-terminal domain phosphatase SSU72 isoform X1 [Ochotona princeps]
MPSSPLRVAVVCSSNQNRSMEAHNILSKRGFSVRSFGTGTHVKLPGPAPDKPNVYDFKTTYDQMYNDLLRKDKELYTQNGILHMLDRNKRVKPRPERFQSCKDPFDLILTCEERVYDQVVEDLNSREQETCQPVHVVNVDIQDNHEEATLGAFLLCELCQCVGAGPRADPAHGGHGERDRGAAAGVRGEERPSLPAHRVFLLSLPLVLPARTNKLCLGTELPL